ncbi:TAXI family TRAP transporter solute-binding subunit [Lacrimispora sp.]|uniref:TAXI family TRAP transporter solute-binding subunit n=1 Tax=Lacrimispora sp. TaxID=2719234 RepID=UPI0034608231
MKKMLTSTLALLLAASLTACGGTSSAPAEVSSAPSEASSAPAAAGAASTLDRSKEFITVLTGPTSGIYFPIGGAFSKVLSDMGYKTSATATGATAENINALLTGQGELAIAMSDSVIQAVEAYGAYEGKEPATDLRAMMGLWPNVCQIVTTADSGIKTFEDMKGKKVGIGAPNSGVELNARMMFEAHGMTYDDCKVDYLSYGEAIDQMKNGQCDVAFVTSGLGNATIKELGVSKELVFIPVEGEPLKNLVEKYPFYVEWTIPGDTYGTPEDTTTVAVMNIMLVSKDLSDEVVYDMLEGFYSEEGLAAIGASHATAKKEIVIENALRGLEGTSIDLHPGAVKFYTDKGILGS